MLVDQQIIDLSKLHLLCHEKITLSELQDVSSRIIDLRALVLKDSERH
jgi:hypothetical protein